MPIRIPVAGKLANEIIPDHERFAIKMEVVRSHPGLALDRYLPFVYEPIRPTQRPGLWRFWEFDAQKKGRWLKEFAVEANLAYAKADAPWRRWASRFEAMAADWCGSGAISFVVRPRWRWIVGLGNESVLETGITLHHTYGVPYLPGSALKGLTRSMLEAGIESKPKGSSPAPVNLELIGRSIESDDDQPPRERAIKALFGDDTAAGHVVILGAVPLARPGQSPELAVDVMTPHFPSYYANHENDAPLEVEDPIPVPFLVVSKGHYQVIVAPTRASSPRDWVRFAAECCSEALADLGVGGKTAKGYGYFMKV